MAKAWHPIAISSDLAQKQAAEARRRLDRVADSSGARWRQSEPVESLQSEIDADVDLHGKVEEQLVRRNPRLRSTNSRRRMDHSRANN